MMRLLWPIVMLCGACGDNLLVGEEPGSPPDPAFEQAEVFFAPDVCTVRSWPTVAFPDRDVDLTVVPTATGAAIFTVERSGGPLFGFTLNARGELDTKIEGTIVRGDQAFTAVSAAFIDDRLVTSAVGASGNVEIDMIGPDLGAHLTLASVPGTIIADSAMGQTRADRFTPVGDASGITGIRFDSAWQAAGTQSLAASVKSMGTARYFDDTAVAWSTGDTCTLQRVSAARTSTVNVPCANPRLAIDAIHRRGYMVYQQNDTVMIADLLIGNTHGEIASSRVFVPNAHAAKIIFDGVRFWVSYLNERDDLVIGYIDANGSLISMALEGTRPYADANELAFLNGFVWTFGVDEDGVGAQRLCLKPVR